MKSGTTCNLINYLLNQGISLKTINCEGMTPLHKAAENAHDKVTSECVFPLLIQRAMAQGFDFNRQVDAHARTVLHFAARNYYPGGFFPTDNAKCLINFVPGINLNLKDDLGFTPLDYAIVENVPTSIKTLLKAGADPLAGICSEDKEISTLLCAYKGREHEIGVRNGQLQKAEKPRLQMDHAPFLQPSLVEKINFFHETLKSTSLSDLDLACLCDRLQETVHAVQANEVNVEDQNGYTLLHVACMADKKELICHLVRLGALHRANKKGITPLVLAMLQNRETAFITLLELGIPLPQTIGCDDAGNPIPFVMSCCMNSSNSKILNRVFEHNRAILHNTFSLSGRGEYELTCQTATGNLLQFSTPCAVFELLKRGLRFTQDLG